MAEEGGENLEVRRQSQIGVSSFAQPGPQKIDPATLARVSELVAKAYEETRQHKEMFWRAGKLPMKPLPRRCSRRRGLLAAQIEANVYISTVKEQ